MKIAEALAERASLEERMRSLIARAKDSARYLEGEEPAESAADLTGQAAQLIADHAALVTRINLTNAVTELEPGLTLTAALARRTQLSSHAALLRGVAEAAGPGRDPYGRIRRKTELPEKTDVPVRDYRAEADRLSAEHRELDGKIQQLNWSKDLI